MTSTRGTRRWRWVVAMLLCVGALGRAPMAAAGAAERKIAALAEVASSSASEKERLGAVTALAKLDDKRTLRPLVAALGDPSPLVRAVAATGLGRLGHKASLPALRQAVDDASETVRARARDAYGKVCRANRITNDLPVVAAAPPPQGAPGKAGFGNRPREIQARPDLYVRVASASDDSPGRADARARAAHAAALRQAMESALRTDASITSAAHVASRFGLDARQLDLSVVKLEHRTVGSVVEIEAQLRLSIADENGRILSLVSGGAIVNVARRTFEPRQLPRLRAEAVEGAVGGLFKKLVAQLRRGPRA